MSPILLGAVTTNMDKGLPFWYGRSEYLSHHYFYQGLKWIWKENHRANAFYEKMQFEVLGDKTFAVGSDIQEDYDFARQIR